jgi:hypothetical protein
VPVALYAGGIVVFEQRIVTHFVLMRPRYIFLPYSIDSNFEYPASLAITNASSKVEAVNIPS